MVIIEYQYSTDDRTGNHDHDAGKVGSYRIDDADAHQDTKAMKRVLFFFTYLSKGFWMREVPFLSQRS